MIGISKKDGKLRAIIMSDLGKKIVFIESNRQNKVEIKEEFKDFQTAVGCKNGPDKLVVTARLGMEMHPKNDMMVTDCAKAFPNANRNIVLEKVNEKFLNDEHVGAITRLRGKKFLHGTGGRDSNIQGSKWYYCW